MKSTDERVSEVLGRARAREAAKRRRQQRIAAIGGGALAVAIVAAVGVGISLLPSAGGASAGATLGLMGGVFAGGSALGYVVVGLLGLALGAAVTVLAYRLGRTPRAKDANSAHILPGRTNQFEKDQLARTPLNNADTVSPDRPNSDRFIETESASEAESVEP